MKKNVWMKRAVSLLAVMLFCFSIGTPVWATEGESADSQSVTVSYTASKATVKKGDKVTLSVKIRNLKMDTSLSTGVDITRTPDSFREGSVSSRITSQAGSLLEYTVVFNDIIYTGKGQDLSFIVMYQGTDCEPETLTVCINECVEYTEETSAKEQAAPMVVINRADLPHAIKAGESFTLDVLIRNSSATPIHNAVAVLEPGEGLILAESKTSKTVGTVLPLSVAIVKVKLKADSSVQAATLSLNVSLKYKYDTATGYAESAADEKLLIPFAASAEQGGDQSAVATPNIIISNYSYGGSSVAAGEKFNLSVTFTNTSKTIGVENIVMAVQTGEALSITSASNTYYVDKLEANASKTVVIEVQALANAAVTSANADISFGYEYVKGGERSAGSATESLSIPLYLPDRFTVSQPETLYATAGEEVTVSLPYINRGKGEISNVEACITFENEDAAFCEECKQNLGNFEAGKSGTIDFFFTPNEAGELKFTVTVAYEDEMTQPKTVELPLTVTVEEGVMDDPGMWGDEPVEEEESSPSKWVIIIPIAVGLVGITVATLLIVKKRKKKKAAVSLPDNFDWDDTSAEETAQSTKQR